MAFKLAVETKRLHLAHTWTIARNSSDYKDNVFVYLEKDGITSMGEAAPNVRYNEDASRTSERIRSVEGMLSRDSFFQYSTLIPKLRAHITDQNCAVAALDMAIFDWLGKAMGQPVHVLFGSDPARMPLTSYSIGMDSIENMQKKVEEAADMPIFKIKLGKQNDRKIIRGIREVTDKPIRVDANEGWKNKEQALEQIEWLAGQNIQFVEQPMPEAQLTEMLWLKERSPLPLFADESVHTARDIPQLANAFHGINIKLMKSCGLLEGLAMVHTARALDMQIMLGCMVESSLAISAAAQIAPLTDFIDLDGNLLLKEDPFKGLDEEAGRIRLSDLPGMGVTG